MREAHESNELCLHITQTSPTRYYNIYGERWFVGSQIDSWVKADSQGHRRRNQKKSSQLYNTPLTVLTRVVSRSEKKSIELLLIAWRGVTAAAAAAAENVGGESNGNNSVKDKARKEESKKRVSRTRKTIESPASFYSLMVNAGEPFNSSSPAIPAAIDKRIIQDSRLFSFSFLFSILLFFHHDDFTFVEIEFPLNGRRRENRSGPSSFYCSGAHHIKLKISIGSVVRGRKRRLHAPATIYGCNVKWQRIFLKKEEKTFLTLGEREKCVSDVRCNDQEYPPCILMNSLDIRQPCDISPPCPM